MKLPLPDGVAVVTGAASGIGRATALARAIERRQKRVVIGGDARFADLLQRLMPARY